MNRKLRPVPFPRGSEKRRNMIAHILKYTLHTYREAVAQVVARNKHAQNKPCSGEKCWAKTRAGGWCECHAMSNGRCRLHGGLSTGPKTQAGKVKSTGNLTNAKRSEQTSFPANTRVREASASPEVANKVSSTRKRAPARHGVSRTKSRKVRGN